MSASVPTRVITTVDGLCAIRPLWERLCVEGKHTIFQDFQLNLLAARAFAHREQPYIIWAEHSGGAAIIPAVRRLNPGTLRLLGDELFDYRCFLHQGDPESLDAAIAEVERQGAPLEILAVRQQEALGLPDAVKVEAFCGAPCVSRARTDADSFAEAHLRLARNLRRLAKLGFTLRRQGGDCSRLVRAIYEGKAEQSSESLFHDRLRIEFMVEAARMMPEKFEIFTLENGASLAAALVTLRDQGCRRFYTGWFAPQLQRHSPALSLIYETTRLTLAEGLDCDYMTGEQPYKLRLATSSVRLYRGQIMQRTPVQDGRPSADLRVA